MGVSFCYLVLGCFVFFAIEQVAYGITCYNCNACNSDQNSWGTTTILGSNDACFKYDYKDKPVSYVNRGVKSSCSPGADGLGGINYCCSTDYCNGSVSLSSSLILVFTLIIAVYAHYN